MRALISAFAVLAALTAFTADAQDAWTVKGEQIEGPISGESGTWKVGGATMKATDVLILRFTKEPPPPRLEAGVFLRGGSLISGALVSVIGENAEIVSSAFGALKVKREEIAGAFSPPPSGQTENFPALARYASIVGSTLSAHNAELTPGKQTRIRFAGQDELIADKVMRIGSEQILLSMKGKGVETVSRQYVRLIELATPPPPGPTDADKSIPEVIVRLKSGDLLRGRVLKLTDKSLLLRTTYMGEKEIDRGLLATIFLSGGTGSTATWLSNRKPAQAKHTPTFDAEFPVRMDASVDGNGLVAGSVPCERGIGVHSRSELTFDLDAAPKRFFALCGMDAESGARGQVEARVLVDGKEMWKSGLITAKDGAKPVALDIGTAKQLTLVVDFGPDGDDGGDHFDWGWAAVLTK